MTTITPHGRHRQLGPFQRFLSRIASFVVLIAVLSAGYYITQAVPDTDTRERPFLTSGDIGVPVAVRLLEVKVTDVRFVKTVRVSGATLTSDGVWLVIHVTAKARTKPVRIGYTELQTADGKRFVATDRAMQTIIGTQLLQPGIPAEGDVLFEIPQWAAVPGLSARFAVAEGYDKRMDGMAEVKLTTGPVRVDSAPLTYDPKVKQ